MKKLSDLILKTLGDVTKGGALGKQDMRVFDAARRAHAAAALDWANHMYGNPHTRAKDTQVSHWDVDKAATLIRKGNARKVSNAIARLTGQAAAGGNAFWIAVMADVIAILDGGSAADPGKRLNFKRSANTGK